MAIIQYGATTYANRVLNFKKNSVRNEDVIDELMVHVWDDCAEKPRILFFSLPEGRQEIWPVVEIDAPEEVLFKNGLWNQVANWIRDVEERCRIATKPELGKRVTVSPRAKRVPAGKKFLTIVHVGKNDYGQYVHLMDESEEVYTYISLRYVEVLKPENYLDIACPWSDDQIVIGLIKNAQTLVNDAHAYWHIVCDRMEDLNHPQATMMRSVVNVVVPNL